MVGLDLGSTKMAVAVGEVNPDNSLTLLALSQIDSSGMRRGNVVDIESSARAIDQLLDGVERIAGTSITSTRVGFNSTSVATTINRATIAVTHPHHEINSDDISRAIQAARMVPVSPDRSVVHIIPRQFIVDGYEGVVDPLGMMGSRLEVEVIIVTAMTSALQNMVKTVSRTGTKVREIVLSSILAAEAVLQPAEKEMGVVLVDIGGGTTDVAVFEQGSLVYASVLPVGGDYITRDLAVGLRTTIDEARRIKENYGYAHVDLISEGTMVEISSIYGKDSRQVSQRTIASIIQPRVEELLEILNAELRRTGFNGVLPAGIVLTGGCSLLKGIIPFGEEYLNMPMRIGYPENGGLGVNQQYGPEYAVVLGNLLYGARVLGDLGGDKQDKLLGGFISRIGYWFKELFS